MPGSKKKLDPIARFGLGVFIGSFVLIFVGMYLTRPDRSIPPYSIGSQVGRSVALHVPAWTSEREVEALIERLKKVGRETRDFSSLKIQPTTPDNPKGLYQSITIYVFSDPSWTRKEILQGYLANKLGNRYEEPSRRGFEQAVRGVYSLDEHSEAGWVGPIRAKPPRDRRISWSISYGNGFHPDPGSGLRDEQFG